MSRIDKIPTKVLLIIVFVLLTGIVFLLKAKHTPQQVAAWWDETWTYRQAIDIGWTGSNLTDFQVSFDIGTSALINAGKMQTDCDDIRITDASGNLIPFWIEENNPGCNAVTNTKIWTKLSSLPQGGSTIYVYYGNSSASNTENGNNVFEFFDDFNDGNADGWTVNGGTWSVVDGEYYQSTNNTYIVSSIGTGWTNTVTETDIKIATGGSTGGFAALLTRLQDDQNYYATILDDRDDDSIWIRKWVNNVQTNWLEDTSITIDRDTWYNLAISTVEESTDDTRIKIFFDGNYINQQVDSPDDFDSGGIGLMMHGTQAYYDNVRVRKGVSTDPTSTPASEEVTPGPVAYWKFDEGVGSTAHDSAKNNNGNFGTGDSAPTWTSESQCISGKCLSFDGNDYIRFDDNELWEVDNNQQKTIGLWFKFSGNTPAITGMLMEHFSGGSPGQGWQLSRNTSEKIVFEARSATNNCSLTSDNTYNDSRWHLVSISLDGSNCSLYIDGTFEKSDTYENLINRASVMRFGGQYSNYTYTGFIDEPKIYPYARTEAQIKADYASGLAGMGGNSSVNIGGNSTGKSLSDGLVGYWNMDTGTGTTIADLSGNGNTGTFGTGDSAPAWSTGKYGVGTSYDGNDHATINDNANLRTTTQSFSFWFKSSTNPSVFGGVISHQGSSSDGYNILQLSTGYIRAYRRISGDWKYVTSNANVTDSIWHHGVAVYDGTTIKLYIDNVLQGTDNYNSATTFANSDYSLGTYSSTYRYHGLIDEVRIYNRALSTSEVQTLYNWAPGPIAYYNFNEGIGNSSYDISGYENTAIYKGSTLSYTNGKFGKAIQLDGASNYLQLPTINNILSVSMWVYINNTQGSGWRYLIDARTGLTNGYLADDGAGNGWSTMYVNGTPASGVSWANIPKDQWVHLYLQAASYFSDNIHIASSYSTSEFLGGKLDDVKIYNYARTPKQILEDMNARSGASKSTLPIAHWSFDEGYGTTANDSIGSNNGTFGTGSSAPTWTSNGKIGKALSFDGNDYLFKTDTTNSPLDVTNITVSAWINPSTIDSNEHPVVEKGYSTAWEFGIDNNGGLKANAYHDGAYEGDMIRAPAGTIIANQWQHIVWTYSDGVTNFFKNGILIASENKTGSLGTNNSTLYIGARTGTWGHFPGLIDEVKIYNYALSEDEVAQDYNSNMTMVMGQSSSNTGSTAVAGSSSQEYCVPGSTDFCSPPVAEWTFDKVDTTNAFDTSGNSNNGTLGTGNSAPNYTIGKIGNALSFDGSNDYVISANLSTIRDSGPLTFEVWFNANSPGVIVSEIGQTTPNTSWHDSWIEIISGGVVKARVWNCTSITLGTTSFGTWNHAVLTYTSGTLGGYLNGVAATSGSCTRSYPGTSQYFALGINDSTNLGSGLALNGKIDNSIVFDYLRTPAQIAWDYNRGTPIAHYKLDEQSGTIAHDTAGNKLNGTLGTGSSAPTWTTSGKIGNALSFDGNDYVNIGTTAITIGDDMTISTWLKVGNSSQIPIISNRSSGRLYYGLNPSGYGFVYYNNASPTSLLTTTTIDDDTWHNLIFVRSGTTSTFYLDGKYNNSTTQADYVSAKVPINIGYDAPNNEYFPGLIDDVQIFNYALTSDQVKTIYNQGAVSFQ